MDERQNIPELLRTSMGLSEWKKTYKPIKNHLSANTDEYVFSASGIEMDFILKQDPKYVWRWTYGDFADFIIAGNQWSSNNAGYYLSELPWVKESDYALFSVQVECGCFTEEGYENNEPGDPTCIVCEGHGFLTKYVE